MVLPESGYEAGNDDSEPTVREVQYFPYEPEPSMSSLSSARGRGTTGLTFFLIWFWAHV